MEWITALAGVVLGAALSWMATAVQGARARRRAAGYISRRLVIALDELVVGSARVVNDSRDIGDDTYDYEYHWHLPERLALPTDGDWTSLDPTEADGAMRLAVRVELALQDIRVAAHYDSDAAGEAVDDHFSRIGLDADELATLLRSRYRIAARQLIGEWDPVSELEAARGKADALAVK